jgi:hypothetical protein
LRVNVAAGIAQVAPQLTAFVRRHALGILRVLRQPLIAPRRLLRLLVLAIVLGLLGPLPDAHPAAVLASRSQRRRACNKQQRGEQGRRRSQQFHRCTISATLNAAVPTAAIRLFLESSVVASITIAPINMLNMSLLMISPRSYRVADCHNWHPEADM